ncbi:ComEA family DNA-binding protein [Thermophilibacter provencensis]|uniref:ComEA family DNA-binding protein n=1 Tax=Thermophilibacter provencensis TaxID=1852386 RepID=A0ABT7V1A6_9ACTN|nr:ComEA family DNA-binding protein [Thermophilibacter provencensis]
MAQERQRNRARLLRKFGIKGRWTAGVVAALAVVAVTLAVVLSRGGGSLIERAEPVIVEQSTDTIPNETNEDTTVDPEEDEVAREAPATLLVHVDGAVGAPGVYELAEGSRVNDAVLAAGGLRDDANTASINLAASLSDGEKIHVPSEDEAVASSASSTGGTESNDSAPININTADVATLDELPGVGESTARAIVEDREANGPFTAPEDLMRVSGIGEKKFARLEAMICV